MPGKLFSAVLLLAPVLQAQPGAWHIDPLHSLAEFSVRHMMISTVRGQFGGVKGNIVFDPRNPAASTVDATIDCTTVNTGEPKRDADLRSAEFFDIRHYPTMKFKSTHVEIAGAGKLLVTGNLTINAVTRPVVLNVDGPNGPIKDTNGREKLGLNATTKVSRKEFGILYNPIMETGGVAVSDEVQINLDIELIRN